MATEMADWAPDPPDLPIKQGQREALNDSDAENICCNEQSKYPRNGWKAKYDKLNAENEQLRLMLRLLLESAGDASQSDLVHRKLSSSLQRLDALSSQPVVNTDMRGSNITDIGRDVHNHVHNHWVTISLSDGNMIIILVIFFGLTGSSMIVD